MSILQVGLVASIPALCSFAGSVLSGIVSDNLLRRWFSLTAARKIPIVLSMLLATGIILCNYTDKTVVVVSLIVLTFFAKGFGALGWLVVADTAPKNMIRLFGGRFNVFCNVTFIVKSLVIGYVVKELHSFNIALVFVDGSAMAAIFCHLMVVGEIKRLMLKNPDEATGRSRCILVEM